MTLPGLKDTFFVLFLLSISNILSSGFDHYFVFNNPMVSDKLMVLDLWTYQLGIGQADYSYSIAVGIIRTFVSAVHSQWNFQEDSRLFHRVKEGAL